MTAITQFLSGSSPFVYCFIFFGKLIEVSLASLRSQLIVKGQRVPGAIVALFEYTFWLCITASAIAGFSEYPLKILVLVLAFAAGQVLGSVLEEKMALGYCSVTAIFLSKDSAVATADMLRSKGHALTLFPAEGIHGAKRTALITAVKRKNIADVKKVIFTTDKDTVITVQAIQQVKGATMRKNDK